MLTCVAVVGQVDGDLTADAARSSHDEGYGLLVGHFLELCLEFLEGKR